MYNIANNFYIGIYMTNNVLHLVSERGSTMLFILKKLHLEALNFFLIMIL